MTYNDFTEMPVWQRALEVGEDVFRITNVLPKSEDYGLTSQLRRASVSISANIAEAFGRSGNKDKAKFYDYSKGSAFETKSLLFYGIKVGYFQREEVELIIDKCKMAIYDINKIKSFLLKQTNINGYLTESESFYGINEEQFGVSTIVTQSIPKTIGTQPESLPQSISQSQKL